MSMHSERDTEGLAARARRGACRLGLFVWHLPKNLLIGFIRLWRLVISPLYGNTCRYYPSCSAYGLEAVRRHGAVHGSALTAWRILRCNPWSAGGVDDVPPRRVQTHHQHSDAVLPADSDSPSGRVDHCDLAPPGRRAA